MIRRPPRSTLDRSSAASDVYKRQPLFTDYVHKLRYVWMPAGSKASYVSDGEVFDFPEGAVIIKNFYYDNVQPGNTRRILETRLMIKKYGAWIFADYVWNDDQTEAMYNLSGSYAVSYTHLRAHETVLDLVCRLLLEKKNQ